MPPVMASSSVRSSVPDAALIEALARPPSLRTARELDRIKEMCNKHDPPLFSDLASSSPASFTDLCEQLTMTSYRRGQSLYNEGDRVPFVFIVLAPGAVSLTRLQAATPAIHARTQSTMMPERDSTPIVYSPVVASHRRATMTPPRGTSPNLSRAPSLTPLSPAVMPLSPNMPAAAAALAPRLLLSVGGGSMLGARLSESVTEELPVACRIRSRVDTDEGALATHTATARRSLRCLLLPLTVYKQIFTEDSEPTIASEPSSPRQNDTADSPLRSGSRRASLSLQASVSTSHSRTGSGRAREATSGGMVRSLSEFALPPPHPERSPVLGPSASAAVLVDSHTSSPPHPHSRISSANATRSPSISRRSHSGSASPVQSSRTSPAPTSPPQPSQHTQTLRSVASMFAAAAGYADLDGHSRRASPRRSLVERGRKLWHVLTDAVALQAHAHRRAAAKEADGGGHHTPNDDDDPTTTSASTWDANLVDLGPIGGDDDADGDAPDESSDEAVLRRRMRFLRDLPHGGLSKWSHEKLAALCARATERRYRSGAVIYRQLESSAHVLFVLAGTVQLRRITSAGGGSTYLNLYADHVPDEALLRRTHARSALDVTTGSGALREVSFEAVAAHDPNTGQEDVRYARAGATVQPDQGYTLLREFDFVRARLTRARSTHYFALQVHHAGHSLRLTLQAHRGAAELHVCTQALLPSAAKCTWTASTHLSAKENAYLSSFSSGAMASRGAGGGSASGSISSASGGSVVDSTADNEEKSTEEEAPLTGSTSAHSSAGGGSGSGGGGQRHHSCEVLASASHPQFRVGWFYACVSLPRGGGGTCDFSLRVATVPLDGGNAWPSGSLTRAPLVSGLASLGRGAVFGLDTALNGSARDEEAVAGEHGTRLLVVPRDDFLACFPGGGGNGGKMNSALADLARLANDARQHRASLHADALELARTRAPASSPQRVALDLALAHYDKLTAERDLLDSSVARFEARKVSRAKWAALAAAQAAKGTVAKKPVLSIDAGARARAHATSYRRRTTGEEDVPTNDASGLNFGSGAASRPSQGRLVQSSGTTGPSQRRLNPITAAAARANALQDEVSMLRGFLREESRDQRPRSSPAATHASLLARQAADTHATLIAAEKTAHGVDPAKHVALDMHALARGDVGVHAEEVAVVAETYSLDDIVANRVHLPLPPPDRLLSNAQDVLAQTLARAPRFLAVRTPPPRPEPPPIKRSGVFNFTGDVMKAQLRPMMQALAHAADPNGTNEESSTTDSSGPDLVLSLPSASMDPPRDLASLESRFAAEIPPANLLALESGSWQPPTLPQTTPRLVSPSRRERKRLDRERAHEAERAAAQSAGLPLPTHPLESSTTGKHGTTGRPASAATPNPSSMKNVRTLRNAVAVYSADDPSVDALREFNRSLPATFARESEFTRAFRAAGLESRPREWTQRPAARPSHALAADRLESPADAAPFALQKSWPLLTASASTPLLLMPPPSSSIHESDATTEPAFDSAIFDLTSVDAQEVEQEAETEPDLEPVSESATADGEPEEASSARPNLVDELATPPDGGAEIAHSPHETVLPPVTHVLPSAAETTDESQALVPFEMDPLAAAGGVASIPEPAPEPTSLTTHVRSSSGVLSFRSLSLAGLSAGAPDESPESGSTLFLVEGESARPLTGHSFPPQPPSPSRIADLAREFGHTTAPARPLSRARLREEEGAFAREVAHASSMSSPLALKHGVGVGRLPQRQLGHAAKNAIVQALDARTRREMAADSTAGRGSARPHTTGSSSRPVGPYEEKVDMWINAHHDDHAADQVVEPYRRVGSAQPSSVTRSKLRPSASARTLAPTQHGFGSAIPASTKPALRATLGSSQSTGALALTLSSPVTMLASDLSTVRTVRGVGVPTTTMTTRVKSASKHGHPARVAPAYLSNSSADVPAMVWLADRMAQAEAREAGLLPPEEPAPEVPPSNDELLSQDPQAVIRPITSPLGVFDPSNVVPQFVPPERAPQKKVPKTYFNPNAKSTAKKAVSRPASSSSASTKPAVTSTTPKSRPSTAAVRIPSPHFLPVATPTSPPLVASSATGADSDSPVLTTPLLTLLEAIPPSHEPVWSIRKLNSGNVSSHFTRRPSVMPVLPVLPADASAATGGGGGGLVMDAAFLAAVNQPLSSSEADAAQKDLHARRLAAAKLARQQQAAAAELISPTNASPIDSDPASPAAVTSSHRRTGSTTSSHFSFSEVAGSIAFGRRAAGHMRAISASWAAHTHAPPTPVADDDNDKHNDEDTAESHANGDHSTPSSPALPTTSLPAVHPLAAAGDRPTSRLRSLPVPVISPTPVYERPKMQPFVNAPMMKF